MLDSQHKYTQPIKQHKQIMFIIIFKYNDKFSDEFIYRWCFFHFYFVNTFILPVVLNMAFMPEILLYD